jgi:hypothetical protein
VLLDFILGGVSYGLVGGDVRELLVVVLGAQLIVLHVAKGGHAGLMIRPVVSPKAVLK